MYSLNANIAKPNDISVNNINETIQISSQILFFCRSFSISGKNDNSNK